MARLLSTKTLKRPLELVLEEKGIINSDEAAKFAAASIEQGISLEELLVKQAGYDANIIYSALADSYGHPFANEFVSLSDDEIPDRVLAVCQKEKFLVSALEGKNIVLITSDPSKIQNVEPLIEALGYEVQFKITVPAKTEILKKNFAKETSFHQELFSGVSTLAWTLREAEGEGSRDADRTHDISSEIESSSVVELVNKTLLLAVHQRASDIHVETTQTGARVRFRIDGVLADRFDLDVTTASAFVSRLLIMSELDITERVMPQDGSFKVTCNGADVEFRFACMPGVFGQNIVLRLLSGSDSKSLNLEGLGMLDDELSLITSATHFPHGMILVAGPTGSGKSTTLYGLLETMADPRMKFITIEDPVERRILGVQQVQVRINRNEPERSLTFARGLRTILRLDPDVIMVGEIRDADTAEISVQASLTGHLVLSTVHANSSLETLHRLQNIGVDFHLLMSSLNLIFSQRLLRRLCPSCKSSRPLESHEKQIFKELAIGQICSPQGCPECLDSGYRGRSGIFEFLPITEAVRDSISQSGLNESLNEIRKNRLRTLYESALLKVARGETDLEEVERVCGPCRF